MLTLWVILYGDKPIYDKEVHTIRETALPTPSGEKYKVYEQGRLYIDQLYNDGLIGKQAATKSAVEAYAVTTKAIKEMENGNEN